MNKHIFTREEAIQMNQAKVKNLVIGVAKNGHIKQNGVEFITHRVKSSNTYTFLRLYPDDIAEAVLRIEQENLYKKCIQEYKESVLHWSIEIDKRIRRSNHFRKNKNTEIVYSPLHSQSVPVPIKNYNTDYL